LWGIFSNFYNVSRHTAEEKYKNVPQARMEAYMGSELYAGNPYQGGRGICDQTRDNCHSFARACHYSTPAQMAALTEISRQRNPDKFRRFRRIPDLDVVFQETNTTRVAVETSAIHPLVVDIVSIGSLNRPEYQEAQKETFGSHTIVRNFFNITERDDDSLCGTKLSVEDVGNIQKWCKSKEDWDLQSKALMTSLQAFYGPSKGRESQTGIASWMCAQNRAVQGLLKAMQHYNSTGQPLPDFLILMKDDTYYNIELFQENFQVRSHSQSPSTPLALAGCMDAQKGMPFTSPDTGFGLMLSRGALKNMLRPLYCQPGPPSRDHREVCSRLEENQIGERSLYREGMSLAGLMYAYSTYQPFTEYRKWTLGYCWHSDWYVQTGRRRQ
jgi:hypothetical protein